MVATIPCLNTEAFISDVVSGAQKHVDQVVVIDDGSLDGTAEAAKAAGALVMSHAEWRGYGAAIKSCFEAGKENGAEILVTLDGDGQHNPDEIPEVIAPILNGQADIVIGSRFLNGRSDVPRYRIFGIKVITFLFNFASKIKVCDAQSGFRAYSNSVLSTIMTAETGMGISVEILIRARAAGFQIREVATSCQYHPGSSSKNPVIHGLGVVLSVVRLRLKSMAYRLIGGRGK